jgi:hypothetical protein
LTLRLEYEDQFGKKRRYALRPFETGTVGSGASDDHYISFDSSLSPGHFSLRFAGNGWMVESSDGNFLNFNGKQVRQAKLESGDRFRAGRTTFVVEIAGAGTRSTEGAVSPAVATVSESESLTDQKKSIVQACEFRTSTFGQFHEIVVQNGISQWKELLGGTQGNFRLSLTLNTKAERTINREVPGWQAVTSDLFAAAPDEIRAENSLEIGKWDLSLCTAEDVAKLFPSISMIALIHQIEISDLLEAKKIFWAWFARADLFLFHLKNSSPMLVQNLMSHLHAVAMSDASGKDLVFFGLPENLRPLLQMLEAKT